MMRTLSVICAVVVAFATCTSANAAFIRSGSIAVGDNTFLWGVTDMGAGYFGNYFQLGNGAPPEIASGTTAFGVLDPVGVVMGSPALQFGRRIDLLENKMVDGTTNTYGVLLDTPAEISNNFPFGSVSRPSQVLFFKSDGQRTFTGFVTRGGVQESFTVAVPVPAGFALALIGAPCIGLLRRRLGRRA